VIKHKKTALVENLRVNQITHT